MIRSMTAFAHAETREEWGEIAWEVRSVNHRYLDVGVRLPEEMRALEPVVRERVQRVLARGKVDCTLRFRAATGAAGDLRVNENLVQQLLGTADQMRHRLHQTAGPTVMDVLRWPGVIETAEQDFTPIQVAATDLLEEALAALIEVRSREGGRLVELLRQRCAAMQEQVARVRARMPEILDGLRERLRARLSEVVEELDPQRIEQEMVIMAQKLDVAEEMDRVSAHLAEVERALKQSQPVGRRLDFLMQELNREANTLGSKSVDSATTGVSVEMKVLIEQMREQVQNIE